MELPEENLSLECLATFENTNFEEWFSKLPAGERLHANLIRHAYAEGMTRAVHVVSSQIATQIHSRTGKRSVVELYPA